MLRLRGCAVVEAVDGAQAVNFSASELPDLILMDLNMPVIDGWEAIRLIRSCPVTRHIPVLAVSAQCRGDWKHRALAAGALECLSKKPIEAGLMDRLVEDYAPASDPLQSTCKAEG